MREAELLAILDSGPLPHAFMTRRQRRAMQQGVDALIDYLDAVTPDPDLEPTMALVMAGDVDEAEPDADFEEMGEDNEPSLGATITGSLYQTLWSRGSRSDLEEECEDEGAACEDEGACIQSQPHDEERDEPILGAPENHGDQTSWGRGGCDDCERDNADQEPALGWPENHHHQLQAGRLASLGSVEGDFDEVRPPSAGSLRWYDLHREARAEAGALLDRHGLRRPGNVGALVPIKPGMLLGRVA